MYVCFATPCPQQFISITERELTRLLADRGVPQSLERGGDVANMDGGAFEVAPDSRAQVAKAVYGGLGK